MKLSISNFRGIASAVIDTARITFLLGRNYQGKSSAVQAAAAVLTGQVIPVEDLPKTSAARLVHAGAAGGLVSVQTEKCEKRIAYPECQMESAGEPFEVSASAAGIESLLDYSKKERVIAVSKILNAEPGDQEVTEKLTAIKLDKETIKKIIDTIYVQGWDAAHSVAKETGAKRKGQWEGVTSERFGDKKAATWQPAEYEHDLQGMTEGLLIAELKQENEWLDAAKTSEAVNVNEMQRIGAIAIKLPTLCDNKKYFDDELSGLQDASGKIRAALSKLPAAEQPKYQACPNCGTSLVVESGIVKPAQLIEQAELEKRRVAIAEAEKSFADLDAQVNKKRGQIAETVRDIRDAEIAEKKYNEMKSQANKPAEGQKSVDDCRARVTRAETRLQAWRRKRDADALYAGIQANQQIIDILSPDGLRLDVLKKCLTTFNGFLSQLCAAAEWRLVELWQDMSVSMGGTPYLLLSKSEKFRVRVALQVATAKYDGSPMVLVDEADILDGAGRNGLIQMLMAAGVESIVAMTTDDRSIGEKVSGIGGAAYWIENGVAEKI